MQEKKYGRINLLHILMIQGAVIVFTLSSVCSKMAGMNTGSVTLFGRTINALSFKGYMWMAAEVFCLFLYAIIWQQIIKHFELSVVYANRAFAIFWSFLWSIMIFGEKVRPANIAGILLVFSGIMVINSDMAKRAEA